MATPEKQITSNFPGSFDLKIDRLLSIIMVLLERKKMSAAKLAEMFEVTPRTIYRDIETINLAGIPIITYPGINGGISIMEGYKIDKKFFTASDIVTLLIGLGSITSTLSGKEIVSALTKVKSLLPAEQLKTIALKANQISIDLTPWGGSKSLTAKLETIKTALNESKCLWFQYFNGQGKKSERTVEPYQIVLKKINWYLQAYCNSRQNFRVFKLARISKLKILETGFIARDFTPNPMDGSNWIKEKIISIQLLVDESLRERVSERCGEENIKPYKNNKLLVTYPFVDDDHGYDLLLSFGDQCECLEPENVRQELVRRVKRLLNIYEAHS